MGLTQWRMSVSRRVPLADFILLFGLAVLAYALAGVAQDWTGPYRQKTEINLYPTSLVWYSFLSLVRVGIAYSFALVFTLFYGYLAAKSRVAEPWLIALLDILQSVPVLGFMPGLVLALVGLFPGSNLGLELAAIVMIFTGQGWNMVFSFYTSVKTVPSEIRQVGQMFRLSAVDMLKVVEIPFAVNGLVWNSMLSMAGGWFFLMVIESFTLGDKDFRLPGLGAYMAVAYERGDYSAAAMGMAAMFIMIVLVDRCIWAPLVVWSRRFQWELNTKENFGRSIVLDWLKRSRILEVVYDFSDRVGRWIWNAQQKMGRQDFVRRVKGLCSPRVLWFARYVLLGVGVAASVYGLGTMSELLKETPRGQWLLYIRDTGFTFLRVTAAVIVGSLWTIPAGVFIGTSPKWTQRLQPVVQVFASFPAPMLFPVVIAALFRAHIDLGIGSIVLMVFASQWYILFNVISGATAIPNQMMELADVFQIRGLEYWRTIIIPALFPSLLNGWITAAGGAWNACIVTEIVNYHGNEVSSMGIGAAITKAAQTGDFHGLAAAVLVMVTTVVLLNRFVWGNLYRLAETRFRLES